ncbi:MAG: GNAT family N-acetyltransferase, partial [Reyranella sp.]
MEEIHSLGAAEASASSAIGRCLLALNNEHAAELSWLDAGRLAELVGRAFVARRIGIVDAFLLAFDQDADYDSPNF